MNAVFTCDMYRDLVFIDPQLSAHFVEKCSKMARREKCVLVIFISTTRNYLEGDFLHNMQHER